MGKHLQKKKVWATQQIELIYHYWVVSAFLVAVLFEPIDFRGSRDLISVLSVGSMKKEFMSIYRRKSKNLFLGYFMEDLIPDAIRNVVVKSISNVFRISWTHVIFNNSRWNCRYIIFQRKYSFYTFSSVF